MKMRSTTKYLLGTSSALVLSAAAVISAAQPAHAQATNGVYMGGSTLASEAFRQILDCYTGATVGGDNFTFSSSFPGAGKLPSSCTAPTTNTTIDRTVQGMYAGVGSGNGYRGYIANDPAQWYGGTATANTTITSPTAGAQPPFPALQPPYVDSANSSNFGSYPYPHVDIALSDSPLAISAGASTLTTAAFSFTPSTGWVSNNGATGTTITTQIVVGTSTNVSYDPTSFGAPIQVPAFEVNVAIGVNVNSSSFKINSEIGAVTDVNGTHPTGAGGAIQLTEAQLCAIFSGLVTNWNDSSTQIPYANSGGALDAAGNQLTQNFSAANIGPNNVTTAGQPYSSASLPIKIVYRTDGSGTSFILTNYLKTVCPLLDGKGTFHYATIFGAANLPSTTFANLITNINNTAVTNNWIGANGSGGVAAGINNNSANAGNIGYVSADFTQPYATASTAPYSASLQNEQLRLAGTTQPAATGLTFVAPTPDSASAAWGDTRLQPPKTTWTWNDYNIYANVLPAASSQGGLTVSGLSVLPLTNRLGAYPLSGTTFMALYSCYNDPVRVINLENLLTWYMAGADIGDQFFDENVAKVIENNGFHHLPASYTQNIEAQYLDSNSPTAIAFQDGSGSGGCAGVTGNGAN